MVDRRVQDEKAALGRHVEAAEQRGQQRDAHGSDDEVVGQVLRLRLVEVRGVVLLVPNEVDAVEPEGQQSQRRVGTSAQRARIAPEDDGCGCSANAIDAVREVGGALPEHPEHQQGLRGQVTS